MDGACSDLACLLHDILVTPLNIHFGAEELAWIFDRLQITVAVSDTEERLRRLLEVRSRARVPFTLFSVQPNRIVDRGDARLLGEAVARLDPGRVDSLLAAAPAARPGRGLHRDVHVGEHGAAQGRGLHLLQSRQQALRPRRRAPGGRGRRGPALLPAPLPHLRPLPGDAGHALLARHLRVRRQPLGGDPPGRAPAGAAHRPDRRSRAVVADSRPDPGGDAGGGPGGRAGGRVPGRRGRPPAMGPLGRGVSRAEGLPALPSPRRRALQRLRDDRGDGRHHHEPARRLRLPLGGRAPPGDPRPPRRVGRDADRRALRGPLPRRGRARARAGPGDPGGRAGMAPHRRRVPAAAGRPPEHRRPRQGHLQERPRPDHRAEPRRAQVPRRPGNPADLPGRGPPVLQRPSDRPRPGRPRAPAGPRRREPQGVLPPDRGGRERGPRPLRARRELRGAGAGLRAGAGRADPEGLLPPQGHRAQLRPGHRLAVPAPVGRDSSRRPAPARAALVLPGPGNPGERHPGGRDTGCSTGAAASRCRWRREPGRAAGPDRAISITASPDDVVDLGTLRAAAAPLDGEPRPHPLRALQGGMGRGPGGRFPRRPPPEGASRGRTTSPRVPGASPTPRLLEINDLLQTALFAGVLEAVSALERLAGELVQSDDRLGAIIRRRLAALSRHDRRGGALPRLPDPAAGRGSARLRRRLPRLHRVGALLPERGVDRRHRGGALRAAAAPGAAPAPVQLPRPPVLARRRDGPPAVRACPAAPGELRPPSSRVLQAGPRRADELDSAPGRSAAVGLRPGAPRRPRRVVRGAAGGDRLSGRGRSARAR